MTALYFAMKRAFSICALILCAVNLACCFTQRGYIVTSPAVFRAGVDHAVSVKIFNHETPVRVNVKLVDLRENMITSVSEEVTGSGTLILKVPTGNEGKASLKICGNCHLTSGFNFYNSTPVTVVNKGTSAFVQTDKPVYKPSQTVRVNVFTVDRDLKPVGENVTAYVVAPNDVRMMQWKDLRPACCGIVNFSFPLSDQPLLGTWTIFVEMQQQSYNTTFEIQKYVLPKFEVAIIPPPFLWSNCEQVSVVAKYVFGKPVVGNLTLNMTVFAVGAFYGAHMERGDSVIRDLHINGEAGLEVCWNDLMPRSVEPGFHGALAITAKVTSLDGTTITAYDDTTPVSRRKVTIQFTKDTREHFKPGLPFNGKIKATNLDGSNAVGVTVRISVSVNTENFFHQEITSHTNGVVSFTIPGLPRSSKLVWIEARVVGDSTGARYRSIFKNIYGWNSPSNCHVLVKPPNSDLTVGERAKMSVTSTCPCNFTLFYEILSRGNIIQTGHKIVSERNSAIVPSRRRRSPPSIARFNDRPQPIPIHHEEVIENDICRTSLTIDVTSGMAPMSRMVVYYVRENGEGIADSVHVPVKPKLDNEVVIRASSEDTKPGRDITVSVTTDPGSCVCLALVDKSVHLMKPGYMLKPEDIFAELDEYDLDNLPFEQNIEWWRLSRSRRSTDMWWDFSQARDAKYAFLESGLVVMTDVLSLDYKVTTPLLPQLIRSQAMTGAGIRTQGQARQASRLGRRHRTFFPETWVWQCFNVSSNSENFTLTVPDSITTWQADAVSLNPNTGIGISKLQNIRAFKNFFVDFTIPYSAIRGEQVQIPLTVYNYQNVCSEVNLTVLIPPGVSFRTLNSNRMMRRLCVQAQSSQTTNVILQFNYLGNKNITASADAIVGVSSCCTDGEGQARVAARDLITRQVLVEAEGIKREYTHSIYFCPNERINISTPSSYTFQFVRLPVNMTNFNFLTKASNNVHITLSSDESTSSDSYEIVLGGSDNTQSWISRNSQHLVTAATDQILSGEEYRSFWVTWVGGNIQVGTGIEQTSTSRFMQWREPSQGASISYVGFATSHGAKGEFRLWKKESSGGSFNEIIQLNIPTHTVPGSERAVASMIGDVMGPTLNNLNNLLRLPYGCGEQNLANFAPNIYVLKYLKQTKQLTSDIKMQALHFLQTGYQRQLTYKRNDGSYSAFGNRDASGSMWLTSFVLKSFAQAREFIYIDPNELHEAKEWIISWQDRNGSFPAVGKIWNKDIQSGVDSDVALTAYVSISLVEAGLELEDEVLAATRAREYLETKVYDDTDSYTASLTAYALSLLESVYAVRSQRRLSRMAVNENGLMHWTLGDEEYDEEQLFGFADSMKQTVVSAEVEMTAYALLTYTKLQNVTAALPIVKWLSKKRNAMGGFSSTQDTCVALQSLSEYAIHAFVGGVDLFVRLASLNMDYLRNFELNNENGEVLQTATIPSLPTTVFVEATGDGCALLQIGVTYNIPNPTSEPAFDITVHNRLITPGRVNSRTKRQSEIVTRRDTDQRYRMEACVRWNRQGSSNMAVLEYKLITGFVPDLESLQQVLDTNDVNLKRYEVSGRTILFYFDEIHSTCRTCVRFVAIRQFETGRVMPQPVVIYDYYEPAFESQVMYSLSETLDNLCAENDTNCEMNEQAEEDTEDCQNSLLGCGHAYSECHCSHECGFEGPPVCASNRVIYMNRCRMESAACELGTTLLIQENTFCESEPDPVLEPDFGYGAEEEGLTLSPYTYYDNVAQEGYFNDAGDATADDILIPALKRLTTN
uniref:C3 and PZP-like alpha-2-macroglobulin domain-containing protein 8 n=1 Tax=Ciona intestinalis TaxID=7719 RepID=UPI00089DD04C|nr:C3 and PZP-like alpha-2-macroglobulin domain-containing protein 8 [Ciona intestinalis]|eukprot:XP_009861615.2 C3 and PZP-like alpha-2-macroglobulin domain-containing protein 8 [Ciona intestinalis]